MKDKQALLGGEAFLGREASSVYGPKIAQCIQGSIAKGECAKWLKKKLGREQEADTGHGS